MALQEVANRPGTSDNVLKYLAESIDAQAIEGTTLRDKRGNYGNALLTRVTPESVQRLDISPIAAVLWVLFGLRIISEIGGSKRSKCRTSNAQLARSEQALVRLRRIQRPNSNKWTSAPKHQGQDEARKRACPCESEPLPARHKSIPSPGPLSAFDFGSFPASMFTSRQNRSAPHQAAGPLRSGSGPIPPTPPQTP